METIEIVVSEVENPNMEGNNEVSQNTPKTGKIIQQNYVLNDSAALKKKLRNETKMKEPFNTGTDSKDGSNVVILMKTSFFEHVKGNLIQDLLKIDDITKIENAVAAKAQTANSGDAYVEYAMVITFVAENSSHAIKLTAYATTCKVMIQPIGDKQKTVGKKYLSRYFTDTFILPWCELAYANKAYDENAMMEAIRNEIVRLDSLKIDSKKGSHHRGRLSSTPNQDVKCVYRTCKYTGLNVNNKVAFGVCSLCGCYEHFECSKTKPDDRELVVKGDQKYFCSICFSKNPTMIAFETNKNLSNKTIHPPATTTVAQIEMFHTCEICESTFKDINSLQEHKKTQHPIECETCNNNFPSQSELDKHIKNHHNRPCITCNEVFKTISELKEHMEISHGPKCTICDKSFEKNDDLQKHIADEHPSKTPTKNNPPKLLPCKVCKVTFDTNDALKKHSESCAWRCQDCDLNFNCETDCDNHMKTEHGALCPLCEYTCKDHNMITEHIREKHALVFACWVCDKDFESRCKLMDHLTQEHSPDCNICGEKFKTSSELKKHMEGCKIYPCNKCSNICYNQAQYDEHIKEIHENVCNICDKTFQTNQELDKHTEDDHTFKCTVCGLTENSKEKMERHMQKDHGEEIIELDAFVCEYCEFEGNTEEVMIEHNIEQHVRKDASNQFSCPDCRFKCDKRTKLVNHYRKEHKNQTTAENRKNIEVNNMDINDEYRKLKNNFERLNTLYQESLEENDKVKAEYTAKINEATEKYRAALAENVELKEKVEVLFKLGRGYINKVESPQSNPKDASKNENNKKDSETPVEPGEDLDNLSQWMTYKSRGFKRVSPCVNSLPQTVSPPVTSATPPTSPQSSSAAPQGQHSPLSGPRSPQPPRSDHLQRIERNNPVPPDPTPQESLKYCHYFTNYGKCHYEEKTGRKCKFSHKNAPLCKQGLSCNRNRCMFTHPNMEARRSSISPFLGRNYQQNNIHPWQQMTNPYIVNPWNMMAMNPYQNHAPPFQQQGENWRR